MRPPSASPPPPDDEGEGRAYASRGEGQGHEGPDEERETYGPLDIERHVKRDGRVLILYARHKREGA